jgi:carboxyl-terminal processing protease
MMMMPRRLPFVLAFLFACSQPVEPAPAPPPASAPAVVNASAPAATSAPDEGDEPLEGPFPDGAKSFAKLRETLLQNYYAEGITEDDLYRAAAQGMLERVDPRMKKWNRLMSAREVDDLKRDLEGEVVGIGVRIEFEPATGYSHVLGIIPGSPSEKAGLVAGDEILTVNGKLYKGMRTRDVVADIRGKAGETVTLAVLRNAKVETIAVKRERVGLDQPSHQLLPDAVGYVRIPSFNDKTPGIVRAALEDLGKTGAKALVVDLRQCPGGSFERAIETAALFLPDGAPIVATKRRGKAEEKRLAKGSGLLLDVPLAVLVDHGTASGAEFVTAALAQDRHARVVGSRTTGKWSVQMIDDLPNGWAFKYTVSLFRAPDGKTYEGEGLAPEVEVATDDAALAKATSAKTGEERIALDTPLRTAKELILRR